MVVGLRFWAIFIVVGRSRLSKLFGSRFRFSSSWFRIRFVSIKEKAKAEADCEADVLSPPFCLATLLVLFFWGFFFGEKAHTNAR